ncbi:MAG: hypothetical protein ACREAM_07815, partial [Blastocatellia bacterium]
MRKLKIRHWSKVVLLGLGVCLAGYSLAGYSMLPWGANGQSQSPVVSGQAAAGQADAERFDLKVRDDMFAGLRGDKAAFARAMKMCEDQLARNPKHPEALVWHGSGLLFQAGEHFNRKETAQGLAKWTQGLREMDEAVALKPEAVGTRVARGATLIPVSDFVPDANEKKQLLERGVSDYEKTLALQTAYFAQLSTHARAELLFGLAAGYAKLGNAEKARHYFERLRQD